jgi:hypothetical protein
MYLTAGKGPLLIRECKQMEVLCRSSLLLSLQLFVLCVQCFKEVVNAFKTAPQLIAVSATVHALRVQCFKEVVDACLCKDPSQRPSAAELLNFRFFRMAREPEFLVEHFLEGLEVQYEPRRAAAMPDGTAAQDAAAAGGVGSRAASCLAPPQLLGGVLRGKSALGLQVRSGLLCAQLQISA